ncbi:MAG: hypothetical protein WC539_04700 [Nitrospirota bacterium]
MAREISKRLQMSFVLYFLDLAGVGMDASLQGTRSSKNNNTKYGNCGEYIGKKRACQEKFFCFFGSIKLRETKGLVFLNIRKRIGKYAL